jgi:hypothetical protein
MVLNVIHIVLGLALLLVLLAWHQLHDDIRCVVSGASPDDDSGYGVDEYYVALGGGVYVRRPGWSGEVTQQQVQARVLPDFFDLVSLSQSMFHLFPTLADSQDVTGPAVIISQDRHRWLIQVQQRGSSGVQRRELYYSTPEHARQYLFRPPPGSWRRAPASGAEVSGVVVDQCRGSLVSVVLCQSVSQSVSQSLSLSLCVCVHAR